MKDVTPAARARAAFMQAAGHTLNVFEDQELVLDLFTLLVMTKGRACEPEDIKAIWLVAGLRYGANPPPTFDALDDSIPDDIHDACTQDDWIDVLNAAAMLAEPDGGNVRPLTARPVPFPGTQGDPDGAP